MNIEDFATQVAVFEEYHAKLTALIGRSHNTAGGGTFSGPLCCMEALDFKKVFQHYHDDHLTDDFSIGCIWTNQANFSLGLRATVRNTFFKFCLDIIDDNSNELLTIIASGQSLNIEQDSLSDEQLMQAVNAFKDTSGSKSTGIDKPVGESASVSIVRH